VCYRRRGETLGGCSSSLINFQERVLDEISGGGSLREDIYNLLYFCGCKDVGMREEKVSVKDSLCCD